MSFLDVFNIKATPDPELRRALDYLATIGSGSVMSAFSRAADSRAEEKADPADPFVTMMMQMATEREVRRLQEHFDEIEQELIEALHENEEKLREAKEELEQFEESVRTIAMADGTLQKVYRDGDRVRFEDGTLVDPALIDPDQASDDPRQWSEHEAYDATISDLRANREKLLDGLNKVQEAGEQFDEGPVSQDELEELKALAADASAIVREVQSPEGTEPAPIEPDLTQPMSSPSTPAPG